MVWLVRRRWLLLQPHCDRVLCRAARKTAASFAWLRTVTVSVKVAEVLAQSMSNPNVLAISRALAASTTYIN